MKEYLATMEDVLHFGEVKADRTGTGTYSLFGPREMRFSFDDGFPVVTTKRVAWKSLVWELLWFLRGETNANWLKARGVTIWDEWARKDGDLGPVYGAQWRRWPGYDGKPIDQIARVIGQIRDDPDSRRMVVSAWNVGQIADMALPPCHLLFQFYVHGGEGLSLKVYQRSADMFLGVPFNISSYALLLSIIAQLTGKQPVGLILTLGDAHVYKNHERQVKEQLARPVGKRPVLEMPPFTTLEEVLESKAGDYVLRGYAPMPGIKGDISI